MDTLCSGLDFVFVYLGDILIISQNAELHKKQLVTLFDRQYALVINPAKVHFWCYINQFSETSNHRHWCYNPTRKK